jgi:hypothetical protein
LSVVRGALPALTIATFIPMGLFYLCLFLGSVDIAIAVSVAYAYSVGAWQYRRRPRVSGMLVITIFMVTVRAAATAASGSSFLYFVIPVAETVGFGLLFVASLATRECLVVRLARDVVPHVAEDLAERVRLCRFLSLVWALVYIGSGSTTFVLLMTQPLPVYLGAHQIAGWMWTGLGIVTSVAVCRWRARGLLAKLRHHPVPKPTRPVAALAPAAVYP